jgi:hypothetical protein
VGEQPAIRWLLRIPAPALSMQEAEAIARAEAERRGWGWVEPIRRTEALRGYRFHTCTDRRGGNVEISVDAGSGEITRAWFAAL